MPPLDPISPAGSALLVLAVVVFAVALRQVFVRGGLPETPRELPLYLLALPWLLLGAMAGAIWWVVGWLTVRAVGFIVGSLQEGFALGRGDE